jgi:hypothetical protein
LKKNRAAGPTLTLAAAPPAPAPSDSVPARPLISEDRLVQPACAGLELAEPELTRKAKYEGTHHLESDSRANETSLVQISNSVLQFEIDNEGRSRGDFAAASIESQYRLRTIPPLGIFL